MLQNEGLFSGDGGGLRRSLSLWDHMSAVENTNRDPLAGLTLDAILTSEKRATSAMTPSPTPPAQVSRTLLDIIRDEEPHGSLFGQKDKKSWKAFRDRLRLKRAGAAWTSSVPIPASDIPIQNSNSANPNSVRFNNSRSLMSRRNSVRFTTVSSLVTPSEEDSNADTSVSVATSRPVMTRRTSTRFSAPPPAPHSPQSEEADVHAVADLPPERSFRPQMSRHNSTRVPVTNVEVSEECEEQPVAREGARRLATVLAEERAMSAREAVAAQEAAEAEAAAQAAAEAATEESAEGAEEGEEVVVEAQPVRMSLMDLLEETDRQMGFVGSTYSMGEEEEYEEEEEEEAEEEGGGGGGVEHTCCVCMVRHKGAAFIPCGHTFCRLCSRELWVQRGNCPLCNGFIVEILDIF